MLKGAILLKDYFYSNIPALLKQRTNWVAWGIRGSPLKSPFNPASLLKGRPSPAKAGVKETWGDYPTAVECVKRGLAQGIGYEFDGGIYGVDLDNVLDEKGRLSPQAWGIAGKLNSYTEVSPSGEGLHIFVFAPGANITRHRKKDFFLEIYNEARYFTMTGNIYGGVRAIESRAAELQEIHDKFLLPDKEQKPIHYTQISIGLQSAEHERFLRMGMERDKVLAALWSGERRSGNESSDDIALMNKLAYWCNSAPNAMINAFLSSPYYAQKDEPHKKKCQRSDYLPNTAKNACVTVRSTASADYERYKQNRKQAR